MRDRSPIQSVALAVGVVFLLVGILGFIPGITSNYDDLKFAGQGSDARLLGLFDTSVLHNVVHLLFGVANWADNGLHLALGVGMVVLGVVLGKDAVRKGTPVTAT